MQVPEKAVVIIVPLVLPYGWEPIAEFTDLPQAVQFSKDQREIGERVLITTNWRGHYEVWVKRVRCWPFTELI